MRSSVVARVLALLLFLAGPHALLGSVHEDLHHHATASRTGDHSVSARDECPGCAAWKTDVESRAGEATFHLETVAFAPLVERLEDLPEPIRFSIRERAPPPRS